MSVDPNEILRIVIVGGGAGGLPLATALGEKFARHGRAEITLVDRYETHVWKPLLHEVAAGRMDANAHDVNYLALAHWHRFRFMQGAVAGMSRQTRWPMLDAVKDSIAEAVVGLLKTLDVGVRAAERVTSVDATGVHTASGARIPADLVVWAAGIQAPAFLADLDGLEVNRANQLVVKLTLQTTRDPDVFAFGDCAACPWRGAGKDGALVPPRAQAARQQALLLVKGMKARLAGRPLPE